MSRAAGPIDSEATEVIDLEALTAGAPTAELRVRGTGSMVAFGRTYIVRIGYREPEYARRRGIEVRTYWGEFRVVAAGPELAIEKGVKEFHDAAALSSVGWRREVCTVSCKLAE